MYRFLISRKTLLLLAGIWIVSGLLLFVAGWLLGRHESAPTVDRERLAEILDATVPVRATAARSEPKASTERRDPTPWQKSAAPSPAPASSTASRPAPPPPVAATAPARTASAAAPPPSSATAPPPSSVTAPAPSSATPPSPTASSPASQGSASSPSPSGTPAASGSPSSSTDGESDGGDFALQIGAFASKENAEAKVEQASGEGLSPFIVPVIDGDRTLYTVRVGRYASRRAALEAAEDLRSSKGIAAVIRSADPDAGG